MSESDKGYVIPKWSIPLLAILNSMLLAVGVASLGWAFKVNSELTTIRVKLEYHLDDKSIHLTKLNNLQQQINELKNDKRTGKNTDSH